MKSDTVILRRPSMNSPSAQNASATASAVTTDWKTILLSFFSSTPEVRLRKRGRIPIASTATNNGTKHSQNVFIGGVPAKKFLRCPHLLAATADRQRSQPSVKLYVM